MPDKGEGLPGYFQRFFIMTSSRRGGEGAETETQTQELTGREGGGEEDRGKLWMTEESKLITVVRAQQPLLSW